MMHSISVKAQPNTIMMIIITITVQQYDSHEILSNNYVA